MPKKLRGNVISDPECDNKSGKWIQNRVYQDPGILRSQIIGEARAALKLKEPVIEAALTACLINGRIYPYDTEEGRKYYPYTSEWVQHYQNKWEGKLDPSLQVPSTWSGRVLPPKNVYTIGKESQYKYRGALRVVVICQGIKKMILDGERLSRPIVVQRLQLTKNTFSRNKELNTLMDRLMELQRLSDAYPNYSEPIRDLMLAIVDGDVSKTAQYTSLLSILTARREA